MTRKRKFQDKFEQMMDQNSKRTCPNTPKRTMSELALMWNKESNGGIEFHRHLSWTKKYVWIHEGECGCEHLLEATITEIMYKENISQSEANYTMLRKKICKR